MQMTETDLAAVLAKVPQLGWMIDLKEFAAKLDMPPEVATALWESWSKCWQGVAHLGPLNLARLILSAEKPAEPDSIP